MCGVCAVGVAAADPAGRRVRLDPLRARQGVRADAAGGSVGRLAAGAAPPAENGKVVHRTGWTARSAACGGAAATVGGDGVGVVGGAR